MNRTKRGFTLVEILIVVIILGILAAIVIPQFTEASDDARESSLASDLQTVRSQVELYKVQHNMYPGFTRDPATGVETWISGAQFVTQLTGQTDMNGDTTGTDFGPYLQAFPTNPFTADPDVADLVNGGVATVAADVTAGWYFEHDIGKFSPCDADHLDM